MTSLFLKKRLLFVACFLISFSLVLSVTFSKISASDNWRNINNRWYLWSCSPNRTPARDRPLYYYYGRPGTNPEYLHVSINNSNHRMTHVTFVVRRNGYEYRYYFYPFDRGEWPYSSSVRNANNFARPGIMTTLITFWNNFINGPHYRLPTCQTATPTLINQTREAERELDRDDEHEDL